MNPEMLAVLLGLGGQRQMIETPEGLADIYCFEPEAAGDWPSVIFYCDVAGVRPGLFSMARRLSDAGYQVLMPNLYFRSGPYPPFLPAIAFTDPDERARLGALAQSIRREDSMRLTQALLDWLASQGKSEPVACVGYCMGGGLALTAAGRFPERVAAAASFHGASLATDEPDSPHLLAGQIQARVYLGVAGIDPYFSPAECEKLLTALQTAGVEVELEVYPSAKHGFAVVDVPDYDPQAAGHHWHRLYELLRRSLTVGA